MNDFINGTEDFTSQSAFNENRPNNTGFTYSTTDTYNFEKWGTAFERSQPPVPHKKVGLLMFLSQVIPIGVFLLISFYIVIYGFLSMGNVSAYTDSPYFLLIANAIATTTCGILIPSAIHVFHKRLPNETYNIRKLPANQILPCILIGIGLVFLATPLNSMLMSTYEHLGADFSQEVSLIDDALLTDPIYFLTCVVCICVLPAISEELLCRSAVLYSFRSYGMIKATLISGMFFALMHGSFVPLPVYALLGILFGVIAYKTRSVWSSVIVHFVYNFTIILMCMLPDVGAADEAALALTSPELWISAVSMLLIGAVFLIPGLLLFFKFCKKNDDREAERAGLTTNAYIDEYNGIFKMRPKNDKGFVIATFALLAIITIADLFSIF